MNKGPYGVGIYYGIPMIAQTGLLVTIVNKPRGQCASWANVGVVIVRRNLRFWLILLPFLLNALTHSPTEHLQSDVNTVVDVKWPLFDPVWIWPLMTYQ